MGVSYIQVAGKSNILIGFPDDAYATLWRVGEQMDDTRLTVEHVLHDVPGDSQGGPQGDPIEQQILAMRVRGTLNLSKWDPEIRDLIIRHNSMAQLGSFSDAEIGALQLRDRSFRIVISPSKVNLIPALDRLGAASQFAGQDYYFWNFPCTTIAAPIETGQGTKFSALQFAFRAWRVPDGHPLAPSDPTEGLVWNKDVTGVDAVLNPA